MSPPVYKCSGRERRNEAGEPVCNYEATAPWAGSCPGCGRAYDVRKYGSEDKPGSETTFAAAPAARAAEKRLSTGIEELDEKLAGGFVFGSTILLGGPPKSCKTTLAMQISNVVATETHPVLYASKEQGSDPILVTAKRIKCTNGHVKLRGNEGDVAAIKERAKELRAIMLVVDSVQKIARASGITPADVVEEFIEFAMETRITTVMISQVAKDHSMAGAKSLEHDVDTVIYMNTYDVLDDKLRLCEGRKIDEGGKYRVLVLEKNRGSEDDEMLLFRVFPTGLSIVRKRKFSRVYRPGSAEEEEESEGVRD